MPAGEVWMRWRVRVGYPVALVYAILAEPAPWSIAAGAVVAVLGLVIRARAAGHLRKHEALSTTGPYAYTRNPLYFGSALLAAGFLVAGRSWIAALVVVAYFALFYTGVMRREESELRARYDAAFDEYAARVPLFWPRLTAASAGREDFSWELYRRNREYQAALGTAAGLLLLWGKMLWFG
jgi:protein-S-isoprenylcysteine O-methyltransferase Ste14